MGKSKYEAALDVIRQFNPTKEYVDACDVLEEAVARAEAYPELKNSFDGMVTLANLKIKENNTLVEGVKAVQYFFGLRKTIDDDDNPVLSYYYPEDDMYYEMPEGKNEEIKAMLELVEGKK